MVHSYIPRLYDLFWPREVDMNTGILEALSKTVELRNKQNRSTAKVKEIRTNSHRLVVLFVGSQAAVDLDVRPSNRKARSIWGNGALSGPILVHCWVENCDWACV